MHSAWFFCWKTNVKPHRTASQVRGGRLSRAVMFLSPSGTVPVHSQYCVWVGLAPYSYPEAQTLWPLDLRLSELLCHRVWRTRIPEWAASSSSGNFPNLGLNPYLLCTPHDWISYCWAIREALILYYFILKSKSLILKQGITAGEKLPGAASQACCCSGAICEVEKLVFLSWAPTLPF